MTDQAKIASNARKRRRFSSTRLAVSSVIVRSRFSLSKPLYHSASAPEMISISSLVIMA